MALSFLQSATEFSDVKTHTFVGQDIGSPAPDRRLILLVHWVADDPEGNIEAVTVDGVPAKLLATEFAPGPGGTHNGYALASMTIPEGTTADIGVELDYDPSQVIYGITYAAYRAVNLSASPYSVATVINPNPVTSPLSTSLTVPDGGSALGFAVSSVYIGDGGSMTWSGLLEDFENTSADALGAGFLVSGASLSLAGHLTAEGYTAVPVSISGDTMLGVFVNVGLFVVFSSRINQFIPLTATMSPETMVSIINNNFARTGKNYTPLAGKDINALAPIINANFSKAGTGMLPVVAGESLQRQLEIINLNFNRLTL